MNSGMFVQKLKDIQVCETDMLVSFDVISLFTKVPLDETTQILSQHLDEKLANLIRYTLTTTYFVYDGTTYEQTDGLALGSPLAPVTANIHTEFFEHQALNTAKKKPSIWYRYMDDTFVVWPHGEE
jgi:hypothetical protein